VTILFKVTLVCHDTVVSIDQVVGFTSAVQFSVQESDFSLLQSIQTSSGTHSAS